LQFASSIDVSGHALVFNRGALGVDNDDFDEKFSLAKTLTSILDSSMLTIAGTQIKTVEYCSW
jgi:hypothetical protein